MHPKMQKLIATIIQFEGDNAFIPPAQNKPIILLATVYAESAELSKVR
jgi:hypothetical protein